MKALNKILILTLVVTMFFALSIVASATTITIGSDEVDLGTDSVTIPVSISGMSDGEDGLIGLNLSITYAEGLTLTEAVSANDAWSDARPTVTPGNDLTANPFTITWFSNNGSKKDGVLANLTFSIPTDVANEYEIKAEVKEIYDFYWGEPDTTVVPGKIIVKGAETPAAEITSAGASLYLDDGIAVKAYFNYTGSETLKVNGEVATDEGNGVYSYKVTKSPKNYMDAIKFTATADDVTSPVVIENVTIADRITAYKNSNASSEKLVALATALEVYCAQAAAYWNMPGAASDGVTATITGIAEPTITQKTIGDLTFNSSTLLLKDKVTLRHYFNKPAGVDVSTAYGVQLVKLDDTRVYVDVTGICPQDLNTPAVTTLTYGGETLTISFAPLAYANIYTDNEVENLVNALYNYYVAADAYEG